MTISTRIYSTTACLFLLFLRVAAQDPSARFERISALHSMSGSGIHSIIQDSKGYLWIGGVEALYRYDGFSLRTFKNSSADSASLQGTLVFCVYEDREGTIWAGTFTGGLNRYDRSTEQFDHFQNDPFDSTTLSNNNVNAILEDRNGNFWVATMNGLNKFDRVTKKCRRFLYSRNINDIPFSSWITSLFEDKDGWLWISTANGLFSINDSSGKPKIVSPPSIPNHAFHQLCQDKNGALWATNNSALFQLKKQKNDGVDFLPFPLILQSATNNFQPIQEDRKGNLWVGSTNNGLFRIDRSRRSVQQFLYEKNSLTALPYYGVLAICEDSTGILWFGTSGGGVVAYKGNRHPITFLFPKKKPLQESFQSDGFTLLADKYGNVWISGGSAGLIRYNIAADEALRVRQPNGKQYSVSGMNVDGDGYLWVSGSDSILSRIDPRSLHQRSFSIPFRRAQSIAFDPDGTIWLGTSYSGIYHYSPATHSAKHFDLPNAMAGASGSNRVPITFVDSKGVLWIGTTGAGVYIYEPELKQFTQLYAHDHDSSTLSNNGITAIFEDSRGTLWIGTWGGGLNKLIGRRPVRGHYHAAADYSFRVYNEQNGLANNIISGIEEDIRGDLWIINRRAIIKFNPATEQFTRYDEDHGMQPGVLNFTSAKSSGGEIFFSGDYGINKFFPNELLPNQHIPPIVFTSLFINGKETTHIRSSSGTVQLPHDSNYITIEFAALDFVSPQKNRYRFYLKGFDRDWVEGGTKTFVSYANLPPGEYEFFVKGSNNDGVWNEQAATINIFIAPPYWRTWWFQSLLLLIAAGAIYAAYRYRIGHIIKLERMRGRIATDLHDDIGTSLTRIALFSDVVKRELDRSKGGTAKARSLAAEIGDTARGVIDSMNDIVWTVDPRNDAFDHVTLRMKNYATKILSIKGIDHVITVDPTLEDIKLPIDFRRNIFLIFKESLNNIIKHAEASRVEITLRRNNGALQMTMRDNGKGISRSGAGTGHGLKNLNDRAGLMKGTCSVEPSSPHGTVITLNVDIP